MNLDSATLLIQTRAASYSLTLTACDSGMCYVRLCLEPCVPHLQEPGVVAVITARDIPGENKVKGGATDSALLAAERVEYMGQPIALLVATAPRLAEEAAQRVAVQYGHPKVLPLAAALPALPCHLAHPQCLAMLCKSTPMQLLHLVSALITLAKVPL